MKALWQNLLKFGKEKFDHIIPLNKFELHVQACTPCGRGETESREKRHILGFICLIGVNIRENGKKVKGCCFHLRPPNILFPVVEGKREENFMDCLFTFLCTYVALRFL